MRQSVAMLALAGTVAVGACGGQQHSATAPRKESPATPAKSAPRNETELTISAPAYHEPIVVRCPGTTGPRCALLAGLRPHDFAATPGAECLATSRPPSGVARVTGKLNGVRVDATLSAKVCSELTTWSRLEWLLGDPPPPPPRGAFVRGEVLVGFEPGLSGAQIHAVERRIGRRILKRNQTLGSDVVKVPTGTERTEVKRIKRLAGVRYAELNSIGHTTG